MYKKATRVAIGTLTLVCLAAIYQYVITPPGWIIVEKIGASNNPDEIIPVSYEELRQFPRLFEALTSVDTIPGAHPSPSDIVRCTHEEGEKITDYFGILWWVDGDMYSFHVDYEDQLYSITIHFIHKLPPMA